MPPARRAISLKAKKDILIRLFRVWLANPDLRLGQLLCNVFQKTSLTAKGDPIHEMDIFNIEDYDLMDRIEQYFKKRDVN